MMPQVEFSHIFRRDKNMLVVTKLSSRQTSLKYLSRQLRHTSVATKDVLCRDKHTFVVTKRRKKKILVAAPAKDTKHFDRDVITTRLRKKGTVEQKGLTFQLSGKAAAAEQLGGRRGGAKGWVVAAAGC